MAQASESKEVDLSSLPEDVVALYKAKCKSQINEADGSITFWPTPNLETNKKLLENEAFLQSPRLKHFLTKLDCKTNYLETIFDYNKKIIEDRSTICSFVTCVITAWSNHYPLKLKPIHIWLLILQAIAIHVDQNSEKLRKKYVEFKGKKKLIVDRPGFVRGLEEEKEETTEEEKSMLVKLKKYVNQTNNGKNYHPYIFQEMEYRKVDKKSIKLFKNWCMKQSKISLGKKSNDWGGVIEEFVAQIDKNTVKDIVPLFNADFSKTNLIERISCKVCIMDICKNYFEYICRTCCGFPQITLDGNKNDWIKLKNKAIDILDNKVTKKFGEYWKKSLIPLLDKFIEPYDGKIDGVFWNSMIKRGSRGGSGGWSWFTGWINILFPIIKNKENPFCVPYSMKKQYVSQGLKNQSFGWGNDYETGIDTKQYPMGLATAPVEWQYYSTNFSLKFISGFIGYEQNEKTFELTPTIGWFIGEELSEEELKEKNQNKRYPF